MELNSDNSNVQLDILFFKNLKEEGDLTIVFDDENKVISEIVSIKEFEAQHGVDRIPFSVIFLAKQNNHWPQKIYQIITKKNLIFEVFLVPVGSSNEGIQYEAVFS